MSDEIKFWDENLEDGYYDLILKQGLKKNRGIQTNWHNITLNSIRQFLVPGVTHLDYAAGPGTLIGLYSEAKSIGVDISNKQINYAKKIYGKKAKFYNIDEFDFIKYENKFDVITVIGLMEFLDKESFIELIFRLKSCLKNDGKLIITTPNYSLTMVCAEFIGSFFKKINYKDVIIERYKKSKVIKKMFKNEFSEVKVLKILNLGIIFSLFSINAGSLVHDIFARITNNKLGLLFLITLKK